MRFMVVQPFIKAYDIIKRAKQKENVQNKIKLYDNLS